MGASPSSEQSYILCSTPRTGSTLLCSLLKSTGLAGRPESYFRRQDFGRWSRNFGLPDQATFASFAKAAWEASQTSNGVSAARVMWGTMDEIVDGLSNGTGKTSDLKVLTETFGPLKFIYITREDVVAQAVSWARAEQSQIWQVTSEEEQQKSQELKFDFDQVRFLVSEIEAHNESWRAWFGRNDIQPFNVVYEDLAADPAGVIQKLLGFLCIEMPAGAELAAPNLKMSDSLTSEWIAQYRTMLKI